MSVILAGWLNEDTRVVGGFRDRAIGAAMYLCDVPDTSEPTHFRYRCLTLASVFDAFYADMTAAERTKIAAEMLAQANKASASVKEKIDGHSGNDQMARLSCALAGYGYGTTDWTSMINGVLAFWYEPNYVGRMETPRYFHSDGGMHKGGAYGYLGGWSDLWMTWFLSKATDWDSFAAETWMAKQWEYLIWTSYSGGTAFDFENHGDTTRVSNPVFINELKWYYGILMNKFPAPGGTEGDEHLRWLYNRYLTRDSQYADGLGQDFVFWDRAGTVETAPSAAVVLPAKQRFFSPPGLFFARDSWDYDASVVWRISGRPQYDLGHRHQDAGSIAITYNGRPLLLSPSGLYDAFDTLPHHGNWYQRTMGQSGTLLIYDPSQVYTFYSRARDNDGGQQLKKYVHPTIGTELSDPYNVQQILQDGGGLPWKRCEFDLKASSGEHRFIVCDLREAHKRRHTDTSRFSVCKTSYLYIAPTAGNGLPKGACLVYHRVVKNTVDWQTCVPWHFRGTVTAQSYGISGEDGEAVGKLWIDLRDPGDYTRTIEGRGSPLDTLGYGPTQFRNYFTGVNYPPSKAAGTRYDPWLKRNTWWVEKTVRAAEERYVFLLMPTANAASVPTHTWVSDGAEPDWYNVTIGDTTYGIHRTLDEATFGAVAIDETAPAEVTGLALQALDSALMATWVDPVDADLSAVRIQRRTSAIT